MPGLSGGYFASQAMPLMSGRVIHDLPSLLVTRSYLLEWARVTAHPLESLSLLGALAFAARPSAWHDHAKRALCPFGLGVLAGFVLAVPTAAPHYFV